MPRRSRIDLPGTVHHVTIRGVDRRSIFGDDEDAADLLARQPGVIAARINMTTRRLQMRWRSSQTTAEQLVAAGFTNVRRYQLGIPVWRALGGPTESAHGEVG
jgi:hypothetical protein